MLKFAVSVELEWMRIGIWCRIQVLNVNRSMGLMTVTVMMMMMMLMMMMMMMMMIMMILDR